MTLAERLCDEARAHQAQLEVLPCFQALASRSLLPESHRALHQALALLHRDLTWALAAASHPALVAASAEDPPLHPLLEPGLIHEPPQEVLQSPVLIRAIALGERMRSAVHREPLSLLGYHYALQLAPFPLPGTTPWHELTRLLEGVSLEPAEEDGLVHAASEAFAQVRELLDALHPPRELPPAYWLNRDAGSHPITADVDELRAAVRAAETSWEEFPYYAWRYGEHGRHFSWSDSAWLVMLGRESDDAVWKHVSWLGRLLAARGMPRLMLERHLRVLHQELVRAKPALQEGDGVLSRVAERMAGERRRFIDDETMCSLAMDFDMRVGPEWSQRLRRTGELLVAAVADECGGLAQAVPSLSAWMCEPSRFPTVWIHAVEDTLVRARALCRIPS
ncbi:hypothetical protein F0U60_42985 [Archangium minus]|uniref:Uncharacterized protein n=1 Tax=Archangium minus TaxID=83450 RepID=A0ABY9X495_9BACT|nr:hypothetical protein F0U60_42985 [Archangium minus]